MQLIFKYKKVKEFDIKCNGIQIIENEDSIEIYNDIFRTIPLFITKNSKQELIVFSNFEDFYTFKNIDKTIDQAGFWEIVLFGSGLWTRTLYKNVKQMPAASKIVIDKITKEYKIERYWDFNIEEDKSIDSIEKAAKGLYDRLNDIFSKFDRNKKHVMGMSGGMDSRITLAFLSKYIPKENLELFTYGFDDRLLEYRYACDVAEALNYNKPKFHKLTKDSYKSAMDYLPQMSGGQIGINHCHIMDFIKQNSYNEHINISNYFSDALFGYESNCPKKIEKLSENYFIQFLQNVDYLLQDIKNIIEEDAQKIFVGYNQYANYSSLNEYKYLTERNQKFHAYLAYIQNSYLVLANYDLLVYMLSVPIKFREQKKILDTLLDNYFKNISNSKFQNISSRDFNGVNTGFTLSNKFKGLLKWYDFKGLNRINAVLRPLTKGHIQLFNKYQTEEQDRILYRDLDNDLKKATSKFVQVGLMTPSDKKLWDKLPLRGSGIGYRYHLISLGALIDK